MTSVSSTSELYLGVAAAELVRREIRRARGNEVCFLAAVAETGELVEPRAVARGHTSAVLAAIRDPAPGGIVLHNHPSGVLEPSDADLDVAGRLWEQGLGFAITNNDASAPTWRSATDWASAGSRMRSGACSASSPSRPSSMKNRSPLRRSRA